MKALGRGDMLPQLGKPSLWHLREAERTVRPGWRKEDGRMQVNDLDSGGRRRLEFGCWQEVFLAATDGATPWWKEDHGRS